MKEVVVERQVEQLGVGHGIKDFGEIYCHDSCIEGRARLVESCSNCMALWEEGKSCGAEGLENVLGVKEGDGFRLVLEEEHLQHIEGWAEEGDGAVGSAILRMPGLGREMIVAILKGCQCAMEMLKEVG